MGEDDDDMQKDDTLTNWSPDDGSQGTITVGKTLNQARGYSEDTYQRMVKLQGEVNDLKKTVNAIAKKVGA